MEKLNIEKLEIIIGGGSCASSAGVSMGSTIVAGFGIAAGTFSFGIGFLVVAGLATAWAWADCGHTGFY
ncbi:hypothetical protein CLV98_102479 [Dyadobacter jejuensis]|uniref:Uncharacterized protein n=1 Tax=Dyadobacter jejuensis TaxID=1082580 RepID=A0A316APD1_9BACT|nr:hypothetical protein [Dyadobacter jejuensis]PWJ59645.1 hypothetical protein CLV98_102479 [Dyadobacter jejuensis]